jgi:ubiquinone/menaquinone biosynthesis C-methylase UbiE
MSEERPAYDDFAPFYDIADWDRSPEIGFYTDLVPDRARSLLELGCGTGTITIPMAQKIVARHGAAAARIVGLDISDRMLAIARERAPDIEWISGDMRAPAVSGPFDIITCCFHVLQTLHRDEDILQCLRSVHRLLARDGVFSFNIYQPNLDFLRAPRPDRIVRNFTDKGRTLAVLERGGYDEARRILNSEWQVIDPDKPDAPPLATMIQNIRQYFPAEIERFLKDTGFVIVERYGDYDRSPFTPSSKRQVVVCGRA